MADSDKKERPPGYNPAFGTQRGFKWKVSQGGSFTAGVPPPQSSPPKQ